MVTAKQCKAKGGKFKDGKCRISKKGSRKKSSNPFKMSGGYIGAFIGALSLFVPVLSLLSLPIAWIYDLLKIHPDDLIPGIFMVVILGFLIGWGVQRIFRNAGAKNPFGMIGSYIGAIILPIAIIGGSMYYINIVSGCSGEICGGPGLAIIIFTVAIIAIPVGFVVGWQVQKKLVK